MNDIEATFQDACERAGLRCWDAWARQRRAAKEAVSTAEPSGAVAYSPALDGSAVPTGDAS